MNKLFYNPVETLSSENSKKLVEVTIKRLPPNAVLYYPRGGQFIQWPAFGGHVTDEWLSKNRCPGEQAPLRGTPLVVSADVKIPNSFPATELLIVTRVEGGSLRNEGKIGSQKPSEVPDQRAENAQIGGHQPSKVLDQTAEIALLKNEIALLKRKIGDLEVNYYNLKRSHEDGMRGIWSYPYNFKE